MEESDRLELLFRLIGRFDGLRASVTSNAAIVVSASALVIAAITFLIGSVSTADPAGPDVRGWVVWCCVAALVILALSLCLSMPSPT